MKRKAAVFLAGILTVMGSSRAYAMTYADGSQIITIVNDSTEEMDVQCAERDGMISEWGTPEGLSQERKKELSDWHKEEMRNTIAYLEDYGISYDADQDLLLYEGKTIRWLIDRQIDDTMTAIQMPEGEIDVYTVRDSSWRLTGVRAATKEEYDQRTKEDEETAKGAALGQTVCEVAVAREESVVQEGTNVTGIAREIGTAYDTEEDRKKTEEYEENGITRGSHGAWIYNGKPVYMLIDRGIYTNDSDEAAEAEIFLIVKRNADGTISEIKQVDM